MNEKQPPDDNRPASGSAGTLGLPKVGTLLTPDHVVGIFCAWGAQHALPHTSKA